MIKLYGISNCDTVKKARRWLDENQTAYEFVDFKKNPPPPEMIRAWLDDVPLEILLNKRGTTWRKLSMEEQVAAQDIPQAVALMAAHSSLIKRPVLQTESAVFAGFSESSYQEIFSA